MKFEIIKGDLIQKALAGEFDVVCHGANCFCTMGAGIALPFKEKLKADRINYEKPAYRGDFNKLGNIGYINLSLYKEYGTNNNIAAVMGECPEMVIKNIVVVNAYTQYDLGKNLDYEALTLCMKKINHEFKGKHIGLPWIGCGIAGGDKDKVEQILRQELKECNVTICEL